MSVAENIGRASLGRLSWAEICTMHPNEWVYLRDVEDAIDGSIGSARVILHDQSMRQISRSLDRSPILMLSSCTHGAVCCDPLASR